jgi:DNA (cytosine-5)-methyltransferase 1
VVWTCEQDPYCRRVLRERWPGVPVYPDVRYLRAEQLAPVEVLTGGFPCQDLSVANAAAAGIRGQRSGLWSEFARLIGELRPSWVIIENVPALRTRGLGQVLQDLATVGYDAEWDHLPAAALGAPHERRRLWIVGYPAAAPGELLAEHRGGAASPGAGARGAVEHAHGSGRKEQRGASPAPEERPAAERAGGGPSWRNEPSTWRTPQAWWGAEPELDRVANGVPHRVDRLRALGNAVVPQVAEWLGRRILEVEAAR